MNKYYVVWGLGIQEITLRETAKFLIDDNTGNRYKKIEGRDWIAQREVNGTWIFKTCGIYELNSLEALKILKAQKERYFRATVANNVAKKLRSLNYDDAVKLNDLFELGVTK